MKKISKTIKHHFDDPGKEYTQKLHFLKRMRERLGLIVNDNMYDHIVACIRNNKPSEHFELKYKFQQTNRIIVFELTVPDKPPIDIYYDKDRKTMVTAIGSKSDDIKEMGFYYDVFKNKISLKHDLGYNRGWTIESGTLKIPQETLKHDGIYYEVVSEGILFGKRFKLDNGCIFEVM